MLLLGFELGSRDSKNGTVTTRPSDFLPYEALILNLFYMHTYGYHCIFLQIILKNKIYLYEVKIYRNL